MQLEATRRTLATNIVMATINAAALHEQVTATERLVELGEQRAQEMAARYKLGSASRDEMLAAEQDAANAAATLPVAPCAGSRRAPCTSGSAGPDA